jgi:sulfonate transport system ATP-binding protein
MNLSLPLRGLFRDARWDATVTPCADCESVDVRSDAAALDVHVRGKRFGSRVILQDVRMQLQAGEIVALVGASGSGKSTLLRIVAGLDAAFDGQVRVRGRVHDTPSSEVGFVFQEPRLFPWCTVAGNVGFAQAGAAADGARVAALLAEVGLAGREDALPKHLSGGQAQRVALARGLAGRPRVLLLDEPFSAVDAFTRMKLQAMLVRLVQRHQVAALVVTHDIDEAAWLADRVLVLDADSGCLRDDIAVAIPRPREREGQPLAAARARIFEGLRAAHAF